MNDVTARSSGNSSTVTERLLQLLTTCGTLVCSERAARVAAAVVAIWTPAGGKRLRLQKISFTTLGATILTVKVGAQTVWQRDCAANTADQFVFPGDGYVGAVDAALTFASSAATTVGYTAIGVEESV